MLRHYDGIIIDQFLNIRLLVESDTLERSLVFKRFALSFIPYFCAMVIAQLCPNGVLICSLTRSTLPYKFTKRDYCTRGITRYAHSLQQSAKYPVHHGVLQSYIFFITRSECKIHVFFSAA